MSADNKTPIEVEVIAGEQYAWCSCGLSATMPLCDGAHKTADTDKRSLKFFPEQSGKVMLCACTKTQNPPYCDGSHCQN